MMWLRRLFRSGDQLVLDFESEIQALERRLEVAQAEIDSMAAVIVRDRARVEAETAIYNRKRANAEGVDDEQHQDRFGQL